MSGDRATGGQFVFEEQAEPFGVFKAARFGLVFEFLESFGELGVAFADLTLQIRIAIHKAMSRHGSANPKSLAGLGRRRNVAVRKLRGGKRFTPDALTSRSCGLLSGSEMHYRISTHSATRLY